MQRQRWWTIVRAENQLLLGSYTSKQAAESAAALLAQDGAAYHVLRQLCSSSAAADITCKPSTYGAVAQRPDQFKPGQTR
jgi:hypothetical protein